MTTEVRLVLAHPGRGRGWWWPGRPVVADAHRLWVLRGPGTRPTRIGPVDQVWRDAGGLVAQVGRRGGSRGGPPPRCVRVDGAPLAPDQRVWAEDGFLLRTAAGRTTAIDALERAEQWVAGPLGTTLVGEDGLLTRGAAPGRSPRPLDVALLAASIRFEPDGVRVAAIDVDGRGRLVDLRTGRAEARPGVPVGGDRWLVGDRIVRGGRTVWRGIAEASCARAGRWLAGPGGWVWDLEAGRPVRRRRVIALGWTGATDAAFVTVDWATSRGWTVPYADPRPADRFALPVDPDDTVVAGIVADGAVHLRTALGEGWRVVGSAVARSDAAGSARVVPDPDPPRTLVTADGPFDAAGACEVGPPSDRRTWAWNDDGWLVYSPSPTNR